MQKSTHNRVTGPDTPSSRRDASIAHRDTDQHEKKWYPVRRTLHFAPRTQFVTMNTSAASSFQLSSPDTTVSRLRRVIGERRPDLA